MNRHLSISQLCRRLGLSPHTLRYYERIGLLDPVGRASNGHRAFSDKDLRWLEFLQRLKDTGMPIRQMQHYAELRRQGDASLGSRRALLEKHRQALALRIEELGRSMAALDEKIETYKHLEREVDTHEQVPTHRNAAVTADDN